MLRSFFWCMSTVVFLVAGCLRDRVPRTPRSPKHSAVSVSERTPLGFNSRELKPHIAKHVDAKFQQGAIVGMALVHRGQAYEGSLTSWDLQEEVLCRYLCKPNDSYSLHIAHSACALSNVDAVPLHLCCARPMHYELTPDCQLQALNAQFETSDGQQSGMDIIRSWGVPSSLMQSFIAIDLPPSLIACIVDGSWQRLLLLGRTKCAREVLPAWPPSN